MDFDKLQLWHYFALVGGGVLVIGIILYFLPIGKIKVPAVITIAFGALTAGLAAGIVFMVGFGYKTYRPDSPTIDDQAKGESKGTALAKGKGFGPGFGSTSKGKTGFPGAFGSPPSSKTQLAILVATLDNVVDKPVTVDLSPEDRAAIAKQLEGLDAASEIKEDDAKARLEAIQKVLEKNRKPLETVGYRWAGDPKSGFPKGGFPKEPSANPFKDGSGAQRLKSLRERLKKT